MYGHDGSSLDSNLNADPNLTQANSVGVPETPTQTVLDQVGDNANQVVSKANQILTKNKPLIKSITGILSVAAGLVMLVIKVTKKKV